MTKSPVQPDSVPSPEMNPNKRRLTTRKGTFVQSQKCFFLGRKRGMRTKRFIFLCGAFVSLFVSILVDINSIENANFISYETDQSLEIKQQRQRICILAGPHKTGTSSVQANLYRWSKSTVNFTDSKFSQLPEPILNWVWPVPVSIANIEHNDTHSWNWTPSKAFYPMMEVLMDEKRHPKKRSLFQLFTPKEILHMYHDTISSYWNEGHNIVLGSEAMDMIDKLPEGPSMLRNITDHVLPDTIDGDQVTVVVMYRTPKSKHLISMWHENCNQPRPDNKFYEWITTTENTLGALDALGMVELFLNETNWNVALIDLNGLRKDNFDISNFVACKVLGEDCVGKIPICLKGSEPVVANVRGDKRPPNVPNKTIDEMDVILKNYDCNYQHLLGEGAVNKRLKVYYPEGLQEIMRSCQLLSENGYPRSREKMREQLKEIALKHGTLW